MLSHWSVCQWSPSISPPHSLTLEKQPPGLPPGSERCACMFLRMLGSLGTGGSDRLGAIDTSWYPLSRGHVWTPTVGIAVVDRGVCSGLISSQWHQIVRGIGCSVPGSSSVRVDDVPSIECYPLCLMSSSPPGRILPPFRVGTVPLVPVDLDHPLLLGIFLHGHKCNLAAPSCRDS